MRCTNCHRQYSPGDDSLMTTVAEQIESASVVGARTRVRQVFLCPECTHARRKTERTFLWTLLLVIGAAVIVGIASRFLQ